MNEQQTIDNIIRKYLDIIVEYGLEKEELYLICNHQFRSKIMEEISDATYYANRVDLIENKNEFIVYNSIKINIILNNVVEEPVITYKLFSYE